MGKKINKNRTILLFVIILLVGFIAYQQYSIFVLEDDIFKLSNIVEVYKNDLESSIRTVESNFSDEIGSLKRENKLRRDEIMAVLNQSGIQISELQKEVGDIKVKSADFSGIVGDVIKSVVSVGTDMGQGSGAIISDNGYIVTNYHVVNDANIIRILSYENRIYDAELIGFSSLYDVAVLKIDDVNLDFLDFGDSDDVRVGERAIALGNPLGLSFSVTEGIVSAVHRQFNGMNIYTQIDVPINPGNSGGPLVNSQKEIIGLNNFKVSNFEGLGFAIESNTVKAVADEIIRQHEENLI